MNRNVIYRYEWRGTKTAWDYRLEFTPPDTTDLNSPDVVILEKGCMDINKLSAKYNKLPIGAPTAPQLELMFRLERIASNDFKQLLINPVKEIPLLLNVEVEYPLAPMLVELYIKHNGNDTNSPAPYRLLFRGGIRESTLISEDGSSRIEANAIDINKIVFDTITFDFAFAYINEATNKEADTYYDFAYKAGAQTRLFSQGFTSAPLPNKPSTKFKYTLVKWQQFIETEEQIATIFYRKCVRNAAASYSFNLVMPRFYKQKYDGLSERGELLNTNELYLIGFLQEYLKGNWETADGIFAGTDTSVQQKYPNSVWDYVTELSENYLSKAHLQPNGLFLRPVYAPLAGGKEEAAINLKRTIKYKCSLRHNLLKTATASMHEAISNDGFADIKKYEATDRGSRNNEEYSAPIYHNTIPTASRYDMYSSGLFPGLRIFYSFSPRVTTLVYFDNISALLASETEVPIRVHNYCEFLLGDGTVSSKLDGCDEKNTSNYSNYLAESDRFTLPQYAQDARHLPAVVANAALELFSGAEQAMVEVETLFSLNTEFIPGGSVGFPWWRFDIDFKIPASEISEFYTTEKDTYDMIESELDFNTETAKVKLLLRTA